MKISTTHQKLADYLNNPRVLENPKEFLGIDHGNCDDLCEAILDFWLLMDTLTEEQWKIVDELYSSTFSTKEPKVSHIVPHKDEWKLAFEVSTIASKNVHKICSGYATMELLTRRPPECLQIFTAVLFRTKS